MTLLTERDVLAQTQKRVPAGDLLRRFSEEAMVYWALPSEGIELIGLGFRR